MKKLIEKFISLFLALSFAFQLAVTGYAEMQGGTALVTNTYGSNNGMLTKSAYGNGYNLLYTYDKFNRVIAEKQGSNALNRFYYDNNGNLATATDGENGIEYNYEYDFIGRLVRSFATKNSADYLTSQITYDEFNRISAQNYILANGTNHNYKYEYSEKDNLIKTVTLPYSRGIIYNYDTLNRPTTKIIAGGTAGISESYAYHSAGTNKTTSLISDITYSGGSKLSYEYDALNNIISVTDKSGKEITYAYDGLGQLVREDNPYTSKTYVYAYDKGGNITSVKTYAYTTATTLGTATSTITYTYGDSTWKDKLTSYNGTAITYDSIGNPLSYRNGTLAWNGRQLKSHTSTTGTTTIYTYNSDGVRIGKKSVYQGNTSETSYVVSGTQILSETKGSTTNYYIYDEKGLPVGIVYNGTTYTYRKNLQGDIIAILDSTGAEVVTYTYNAWGVATVGGTMASTLGAKNPFRYRGYYYDTETGFYYLNSRYYDPVTGRFLNADGYVSTGQGLLGTNMYAYCGNNPVMRADYNGEFFNFIGELFNNIGNTMQSFAPVYAGCGGAAIVDGPLPFGDIAAGIVATGATIFAVGVGVYDTVIRADNMPKEDVDEKDKDKKRPEIQTNYWRAELINHAIVPLYPLTYSQARVAASEEKNILCMNFQSALAIVKFYPSAIWDSAHGCKDSGYLDHFHLSSAHKNHIWYFG